MPSVILASVSFAYTSAHEVLSAVDLSLGPGWVGVVGPNGAGKSTLLDLIAGRLVPTVGTVTVDSDVPPMLCSQRVEDVEPSVVAFAESYDGADFARRGRLRLDPDDLLRWPTLSPGERKRWQVGAALSARPDVLLLDEPTNHLDRDSRALLQTELRHFGGVGLVVSHDRHLLDDLTGATIRVDRGTAVLWGGPYSTASEEWAADERAMMAEHERTKRQLAKAARRIADGRRSMEARSATFARTMRTADAKDHDTHSTARKGKHRLGQAAAAKGLSNLAAERDRLSAAVDEADIHRSVGGSIRFEGEPAPRPVLVRIDEPIKAEDRILITHAGVDITRDSRVHVTGPNGAGKSTLLATVASRWDLPSERLLFLPQEMSDDDALGLLTEVRALSPDVRGRIMQIVARLGAEPGTLLASERLSPGEARKLAIAGGLATEAWLLVLDEPTNHLDLPTVTRLEHALAGYRGALVVVSHDEAFGAAVTDEVWDIRDGFLLGDRSVSGGHPPS
jgi:ATPase subunit of ABC transporter with duplicated ATPase domains